MSFMTEGEQVGIKDFGAKSSTKIIVQVKGRKRKEVGRIIEHRSKGDSGARRIVAVLDKKGKLIDRKYYDGEMLNKVQTVHNTKKDKKVLIKQLKRFINQNSNVRLTEFGLRRLILDDMMETIPDEEII